MPELPEVETIRLGLQKKIVGLKIKEVEVLNPKTFQGDSKTIQGKKILNVWRKAKILGVDLSDDLTLLFHLKMSGQLVLVGDKRFVGGHPTADMVFEMPNKSTRVIFTLENPSHKTLPLKEGRIETSLYFNDQRKFGWVKVVKSDELRVMNEELGMFGKLGPEPLKKEFTWQILKQRVALRKSLPIKVAILDQVVISGVGNIYASESCFNAKLDPRIRVKDLTDKQLKSLHQGIVKALRDGIKYGGSSRAHFVDSDGHKGYFLDYAYVYGRDKHPCKICKTPIEKIQLGGRGTFFCPKCQKGVE